MSGHSPNERGAEVLERRQDPPVRDDGRCARPGCSKPLPRSKQLRRYAGVELDRDPFCSSGCCRAFHGCELETSRSGGWDDPEQAERNRERQRVAVRGSAVSVAWREVRR